MTPDELRRAIDTSSGRLNLSLAALSPVMATGLGDLVPGDRLVLAPILERTDRDDGTTITGTGAAPPFQEMTVRVDFTLDIAGDLGMSVTATGDGTWSFAGSFAALRGSLFESLRFDQPVLALSWPAPVDTTEPDDEADDDEGAVLSFRGTLTAASRPALLDVLFPTATHALTGEVRIISTLPGVDVEVTPVPAVILYGPQNQTFDLGLFTLRELRYEIMAEPWLNWDTADWDVDCTVVVTGSVPITVGGEQREILVSTNLGDDESFLLGADFSEVGELSLAEVAQFAGQHDLPVPFDFGITGSVRLTDVRLHVIPSGPTVDFITVQIETQEEWTIADLFTLQAIDVQFRVDSPLSAPSVSVLVTGLVGIGNSGTLVVGAGSATRSLGAMLREDDPPLSIREVYADVTGEDADHLPDLFVVKFDSVGTLPGDGQPASFDGYAELDGDWAITSQLTLLDVQFRVGFGTGGMNFLAAASFLLQGLELYVTAAYDPVRKWQFRGETGPGQRLPIGELGKELGMRFGVAALPAPVAGLTIENLGVDIATGPGTLMVTGQARFPLDRVDVAITLTIDTGARTFAGELEIDVPAHTGGTLHLLFDARFAAEPTARLLLATYSHPASDPVPEVKALVGAFSTTAAEAVPEGIVIDLRDVVLAVAETPAADPAPAPAVYILGVDLAATLDFARLPVVGEHLSTAGPIGLSALRVLVSSVAVPAVTVAALNPLLPDTVTALPGRDLAAGATVEGVLRLGPLSTPMAVPMTAPSGTGTRAPAPTTAPTPGQTAAGSVLWYKVQRTFGPFSLDRVGLAYQHPPGQGSRLAVLLDASVSVGPLALSLDGLAIGLSLADPTGPPSFDLGGMGVGYAAGPVEISGAFLKGQLDYAGQSYPAYSGSVQIRTEQLTLAAIGSYAQLDMPSLFVYAVLNDPIGGPPFFFVRGLAAGFGYNRRLVLPDVTGVTSFPLVTDAVSGPPPGSTLGSDLQRLQGSLVPSIGDYFLAAGIHFTSFGMIDTFVLLAAGFGHRFELDVLGLSTLTLPAPTGTTDTDPIAEVQLALRATFVPEDGYLTITAQLTPNSFVLSRACHLRGGFAFSTWFSGDHEGDFVITAGGYHPHFPVPAHYPAVPRLGFDWQVCPELTLSGTGYYALTPGALMAGGSLAATWRDNSLLAWFSATMDFLIGWQPYYYEAGIRVAIGASYTFSGFGNSTINAHVGADVQLWGPDFGGTATLDLDIISVTISFGSSRTAAPQPLPWAQLRSTLLPAAVTTITLRSAGTQTAPSPGTTGRAGTESADLGVIDPAGLVLATDSLVPSTAAVRGTPSHEVALVEPGAPKPFGVGASGKAMGTVTSTQRITITREGEPVEERFGYEAAYRDLPAALWGERLTPTATDPQLVTGLLTGWMIRPLPPTDDPAPASLTAATLTAATPLHVAAAAIDWTAPAAIPLSDADTHGRQELIRHSLSDATVTATRVAALAAVLPGAGIDLDGFDPAVFSGAPQVALDA